MAKINESECKMCGHRLDVNGECPTQFYCNDLRNKVIKKQEEYKKYLKDASVKIFCATMNATNVANDFDSLRKIAIKQAKLLLQECEEGK